MVFELYKWGVGSSLIMESFRSLPALCYKIKLLEARIEMSKELLCLYIMMILN